MTDQDTQGAELLPCPHCADAAWIINSPVSDRMAATCRNCGATGGLCLTEAEAITAWNKRAATQGEPVAWMYEAEDGLANTAAVVLLNRWQNPVGYTEVPLYRHPPAPADSGGR